jgi:hypothetical protein
VNASNTTSDLDFDVANITIIEPSPTFLMACNCICSVNESVWNSAWYDYVINDKPEPPTFHHDSFICAIYCNAIYGVSQQDQVRFTVRINDSIYEPIEFDAIKVTVYNGTDVITIYGFTMNDTYVSLDWIGIYFFGHGSFPLVEHFVTTPYVIVTAEYNVTEVID